MTRDDEILFGDISMKIGALGERFREAHQENERLRKAIERACVFLKEGRHPFEALHVLEQSIGPQHGPWSDWATVVVDGQSPQEKGAGSV